MINTMIPELYFGVGKNMWESPQIVSKAKTVSNVLGVNKKETENKETTMILPLDKVRLELYQINVGIVQCVTFKDI